MTNNSIAVKIKYADNRQNPAEVFEAMGLYIRFHTDIGQLILNTLDNEYAFNLSLSNIEKSSIISWLSPALDKKIYSFYKRISNLLVSELIALPEEITDDDIEHVAELIQNTIKKEEDPKFPPVVNRKALKHAIKSYSAANEKIYTDEPVEFIYQEGGKKSSVVVNVNQRLKRENSNENLAEHDTHELHLIVISPKNAGNGAWTFRSPKLARRFDARISDKDWLRRYQAQIINPIGPKDVIVAKVRYAIDSETNEIAKAEILYIKEIIRSQKQRVMKYE